MIKRLRIKFICINMLIVTIMLGVILGMVLHFTNNSMEMESMRMMQKVGDERDHGPKPRGNFCVVSLDDEGNIVATEEKGLSLTDEEIDAIASQIKEMEDPFGELQKYDLRYLRKPVPDGERLVLGDTSVERSMLTNLVRDCLVIGAAALLVFFVISLLLARWAVKPVEQAWVQQRQFVADASHELKTPLTVILTNAELLQSEAYDETQKDSFSKNILTMSRQMRGLVENLLEQARVDSGSVAVSKTRVDFCAAVTEAVLSFEVLFFEKRLELNSNLEDGLYIMGSQSHIRQVVEILLDNALKYSNPGVTYVTLRRQGHTAVFGVSNPGEPISEQDLRNIFKRFYRVDQARSMNCSYGLGLSIAEGIVHEHGGKIKAESENGMNTFTVSIPLIK